MGIVLQAAFLPETAVRAGRLAQLFPKHALPARAVNTADLPDRYRSPKLRRCVDFLAERVS
ncbi:hypothetical protein GCN74_15140 [Janthinobacterium sp. FT14W]|nr:hypothetical protein GCN74_15140 [Janthinobacterium sp. FT14W]